MKPVRAGLFQQSTKKRDIAVATAAHRPLACQSVIQATTIAHFIRLRRTDFRRELRSLRRLIEFRLASERVKRIAQCSGCSGAFISHPAEYECSHGYG